MIRYSGSSCGVERREGVEWEPAFPALLGATRNKSQLSRNVSKRDLGESGDRVRYLRGPRAAIGSAGAQHVPPQEFSAGTSSGRVRGKNASQGYAKLQADTRSFDSVSGLASESTHSAQDDRAELTQDDRVVAMSDLEVFRAFVLAGQRLAEIHVHYEQQPEYPLIKKEKEGEKLDYRVTKMRLSKDKTTLTYNQFLTLSGIPKETYEYRLGNRSALEWVIDQYQVSTDKRSGITNDPNRDDDPTYILRLIAQVITVSLETAQLVRSLPPIGVEARESAEAKS